MVVVITSVFTSSLGRLMINDLTPCAPQFGADHLGPVPPVVPWALPSSTQTTDSYHGLLRSSLQGAPSTASQVTGANIQGHDFSHMGPAWVGVGRFSALAHTKQMQVIISGKCTEAGMLWFKFSTTPVALLLFGGVCALNTLFICCGMADSHLCSHTLRSCQGYNGFSLLSGGLLN